MAGKPFILERWEQAIVANLFGWHKIDAYGRQCRRFSEALIYVPRKNGKQLDLDTPLPTPKGWTNIGDLRVGDELFDQNGLPCKVVCLKPIEESPESYKVRFSNGEVIKACADHLWVTTARVDSPGDKTSGRSKRPLTAVRTTKRILQTLHYGARGDRNHSVSMPGPLQLNDVELPVSPYVLGAWLGDGDSDCARFTVGEKDYSQMIRNFEEAGYSLDSIYKDRRNNVSRVRINPSQETLYGGVITDTKITLNAKLRCLGLFHNKHIPEIYLRSSISQRCALLQGIVDTDGFVEKRGYAAEIVTVRPRFAKNIGELLASLGIKYSCRKSDAMLNGEIIGPKYRIQFMPPKDINISRLERKQSRLKWPEVKSRSQTVQITSIEPCEPVPMRCIAVDSPSNTFLCGRTMLPTHNTPLAGCLMNAGFFLDSEAGQQNYCAAGERDQASLSFRHIDGMQDNEIEMSSRVRSYTSTRTIVKHDDQSFIKVLSSDAKTKHGGNPHIIIVDELHVQPDRRLVDVFQTAMASLNRLQPLLIYLTTADFDRESICNEKYDYACKVRDNIIKDPAFLPVIYEAMHKDKSGKLVEDDWTKVKTWRKANPNLGISVSIDFMKRECRRAQETPTYENTFKRLHLNIRTAQDVRWIPADLWDDCNFAIDEEQLKGKQCFVGFDLSTNTDIAGYVLLFLPDDDCERWQVLPRFYIPKDNAEKREDRDRVPYITWAREGLITLTEGNVIDYDTIKADFEADCQIYNMVEIAFDRWNFEGPRQRFIADGAPEDKFVSFGQGFASMSAPAKELEKLLLAKELAHGDHPVLKWMASNVAVEMDAAGNIKPSKKISKEKIDGIVMLIMALGRAMVTAGPKESVYESRGIITI